MLCIPHRKRRCYWLGKEDFTEHKEVVSRLREPLKIKAVAITSTDPDKQGHMLELSMNVGWGEIDQMKDEAAQMVSNMINIIEGPMRSRYMGIKKTDSTKGKERHET